MAKKKMSLRARVARAEALQKVAWERSNMKELQRREASLQTKGAQIWVALLLSRLGNQIEVTPDEIERAKSLEFGAMKKDNGNWEIFLLNDGAEKPDSPDTK